MPCVSDFVSQADLDREAAARVRAIEQPLRDELDNVTRLLCEVLSSRHPFTTTSQERWNINAGVWISPELEKWWQKHQEADRKRKEKEEKEKKIKELEREVEKLKREIK